MRTKEVYALTLRRGVELVGSETELSRLLGITVSSLRSYLAGTQDVPASLFLQVVDLLYPVGSEEETDSRQDPAVRPSSNTDVARQPLTNTGFANPGYGEDTSSFPRHFFASNYSPKDRAQLLMTGLDAAIQLSGTDLGTLQLVDSSGDLRIEAQRGFSPSFLKFFERVSGRECACGAALNDSRQIFVADVESDPIFAGSESQQVVLNAGVRSVTSSPIVTHSGRVMGMLSTHYREPRTPNTASLAAQQLVSKRLAALLEA